jgi:hypothetical protein
LQAETRQRGQEPPGLDGQLSGARATLDAIRASRSGEWSDTIVSSEEADVQPVIDGINAAWRQVSQNPPLAAYKLQSVAYKYSWLLIPLSLPFLWLLFPFSRRFYLYDHMVFVTYSLSFMLVLLALMTLSGMNTALDWLTLPLLLYACWHLYRQLRGTYGLSRRGALLRLPLLLLFALFVLVLWGGTLLALVVTG